MNSETKQHLAIEWWPIDRPIPYARNPRIAPDEAIAKVAGSIAEFGFQSRGLGVDDGESTARLTLGILGKDMIVGNANPAQDANVRVGGKHLRSRRAVHGMTCVDLV